MSQNKKTVITYGTYDMLHIGHLNLLQRSKALGDHSTRRYKIYDELLQENKEISFQALRDLTTDYHYLDNLEKINAIHIVNPLVKPIYEQITSKRILGIPNIVSLEEYSTQENAYLKLKQVNEGNILKEWDEALLKLY